MWNAAKTPSWFIRQKKSEGKKMGLVLQAQRRAIESLRKCAKPLPKGIGTSELFLDDERRLYIAGVSQGTGTCSDVHGMDVLVLDFVPPTHNRPYIPNGSSVATSQYAVLLRSPTKEELREQRKSLPSASLLAIELLEPIEGGGGRIIFRATGKSECYVRL